MYLMLSAAPPTCAVLSLYKQDQYKNLFTLYRAYFRISSKVEIKMRPEKATEEDKLRAVLEAVEKLGTCLLTDDNGKLKGRKNEVWEKASDELGGAVKGSTLYFEFSRNSNLLNKYKLKKGNLLRNSEKILK